MKRKEKKIKYKKETWKINGLFPLDFLECSYWPFARYILKEDQIKKTPTEIKRDWKLKPKGMSEDEKKIDLSLAHAFFAGAGINKEKKNKLKADNELVYNYVLAEIFSETYNLTNEEKFFNPQITISKDFAEIMAVKSKAMNVEPYSFMADLSNEKPELHNPQRYDFNIFILGVGWEMERVAQEKAMQEIKKSQNKTRR